MDQRVAFDFEIEFTNGGGLQGQDFRLDVPERRRHRRLDCRCARARPAAADGGRGPDPKPAAHPGAAQARHSSGSAGAAPASAGRRLVDLSHPIEEGMTTYPACRFPRSTRT